MKKTLIALCVSLFSSAYSQNLNFTDSKFKSLILSSNPGNSIAKDVNGNSIAIDANGDGEIQLSEAQQVKILKVQLPTFASNLVPDSVSDATLFANVEELYIYHAHSVILNYLNNNYIRKVKYMPSIDVNPSIVAFTFDNCSSLQTLNDVITSPVNSQYATITAEKLSIKNCSQLIPNQIIEGILKELTIENSPVSDLTIIVDGGFEKLNVPNLSSLVNIKLSSLAYGNFASIPVEVVANDCVNLQQITTQDILPYISLLNVNGCSSLKKIKGLNAPNIDLSSAGLVNLEELDCGFYNRYIYTSSSMGSVTLGTATTLNLAGLPSLKKLVAFNQPISTVNFSPTPLLEEIDIVNTARFMPNVNISNLSHLHTLKAFKPHENNDGLPQNLELVNAQNCTSLVNLKLGGNAELKELNLNNCSSLVNFFIGYNNNLEISFGGNLNTLNLLGCTALKDFIIQGTQLNTLDLSQCSSLENLSIEYCSTLINAIMPNNSLALSTVTLVYCPLITQFDVSNASNLYGISVINMSGLVKLNLRNGAYEGPYFSGSLNNNLSVCIDDVQLADAQAEYPDIYFSTDCSNLITTVWNGTSWSNGAPTANITAIIDAPYSTVSNPAFTAKNIIVNKDAVLEITSGNTINAGDVTIKNDGNLIQRDGSVLNYSGVFTVRKKGTSYVDQYAFWSSPVMSQNLSNIYESGGTPQFITEYNTATDYFVNAASTTSAFAKGYSIKTPMSNYFETSLKFVGTPNNGTQTFTLSTAGNGYNLVGNPYPSNLDLVAFYNANLTRILNTFYFWDNTSNSVTVQGGATTTNVGYATYNPVSQIWTPAPNISVIPTENSVKIGQGFIVKATNTADTSLSFNNDMRTAAPATFYNKNNSSAEGKFWLRLNSSYNTNNTFAVAYINGASNSFDQYDSKAIGTGSDAFYTLAGTQKLVIQGRESFNINDVVPVGAKHFQNGNFTISLVQKEGIFNNGQSIYLHDKVTGTYTDLQNNTYSFAANSGDVSSRFEIVYKLGVLSTSEVSKDSFEVYRNGDHFVVRNNKNIDSVIVYDASGRQIQTVEGGSKEIRITLDAKGVYVVKAVSEGKEYTKKIIK
ncbi:T9SS type A sorting domain-containing protein [Flavobacteriaceae bacterium W22]|nr:T9SS type A sorting domain-containing protein [Flavobacteriaceae bacterium W22]